MERNNSLKTIQGKLEALREQINDIKARETKLLNEKEEVAREYENLLLYLREKGKVKFSQLTKAANLGLKESSKRTLFNTTIPRRLKLLNYLSQKINEARIKQVLEKYQKISNEIKNLNETKKRVYYEAHKLMKLLRIRKTIIAKRFSITKQAIDSYFKVKYPWLNKRFYLFIEVVIEEAFKSISNRLKCWYVVRTMKVWGIKYTQVAPYVGLTAVYLGLKLRKGWLEEFRLQKLIEWINAYQKDAIVNWPRTWGGALRLARCSAGLTVNEVAQKTGYSPISLILWEGNTVRISEITIRKLCAIYGIDPQGIISLYNKQQKQGGSNYGKHKHNGNSAKTAEERIGDIDIQYSEKK